MWFRKHPKPSPGLALLGARMRACVSPKPEQAFARFRIQENQGVRPMPRCRRRTLESAAPVQQQPRDDRNMALQEAIRGDSLASRVGGLKPPRNEPPHRVGPLRSCARFWAKSFSGELRSGAYRRPAPILGGRQLENYFFPARRSFYEPRSFQ